ncbi:AsmA-like C-terminal region-containing protein [Aquabacter cavernae]|uniref:AsmA family protein n=1 Tax=Aquabacter cavernae TaxID=2496029 RepID=UPI000F8C74F7|nr:AsmA-like C-terminal region-containing protein [Aquabacter cavernae]
MQGLLITIATAIMLAVGAAFAAPFVVDWTAWRSSFESEASRVLGVPVLIRGPIEAELLPSPRLTLRTVSLGADSVSSGGTVDELRAEFSLGALMRGQWEARGVVLVQPKIRIVLDTAGRLVAPTGAGAPANLTMERVALENGTLTFIDRSADRTVDVSDVTLRGEMRAVSGPMRLEGEATAFGQRHGVRLSVGKPADEGARLRLITEAKAKALTTDLDGLLRLDRGTPRFEGRATLARGGPPPALPWRISATAKLSPEALVAEGLDLSLGDEARPVQLAGSARLSFGRALGLDMVLNARAVDADPLLAQGTAPRTPGEALAALGHVFADLPAPGLPVRIGAAVDQLTLGGTVVRDARLDLTGQPSGWRIDTAEAKLPGQTALRLSGTPAPGAGTTFAGELSVTSQEPSAFLRWAAPQGADPYAAALTAPVRLSARLSARPERLAAEGVQLSVGEAKASGSAVLALASTPRLDLDLALEGLDLDPVIAAARGGLSAMGGTLEGTVALQGKSLRLSGLPLGRLALKADAVDGGWALRQFSVEDLAGLKIDGSGRFARLTAPVEGEIALTLSGSAADGMVPLARLVAGSEAGDVLARLAPVAAPVALSSRARWLPDGSEISAEGTLGILSGRAVIARGRSGAPEKADVAISATDAARALGVAGIADLKPGQGAGRLDLTLTPAPTGARFEGRLALGQTLATGSGTVRFAPDGTLEPRVRARLESPDLAGVFTLLAGLNMGPVPARLGFDLARDSGAWRFDAIDGAVAGAPISGAIALEGGGTVPRITGTLTTETLSLARIIGLWGARPSGQEAGNAIWSAARFDLANPLQASLSLTLAARRLALSDAYVLSEGRVGLVSEPQVLEVRDLTGTLGGGTVSGALTLRRRPDSLAGDGRLVLEGVASSALLAPLSPAAPPSGRVNLALDLVGAGRSPLLFVQSLSGQGTLGISGLSIPGVDPRALAAVLADTAAGAPPDERRTAQMLDRALQRGPLKLEEVEGALSVVNGTMRLSPARASVLPPGSVSDTPVRTTFSGTFDPARLLMDIGLTLDASEPGGADAGGVIQWRGSASAPERRITAVALANAIAMRAIERETRRLEERQGFAPAGNPPAPAPGQTPAVPVPAAPTPPAPAPAAPATAAPAVAPTAPAQASPAAPPAAAPAAPNQASPAQSAPVQAAPIQAAPAPAAPAPSAPSQAAPTPSAPPLAAPVQVAPNPAVPAQTPPARAATTPRAPEVRPSETRPVETRPVETRPITPRPAEPRQGQAAAAPSGGSAPPLAPPQDIKPLAQPQAVRPELDDLPYRAPAVSGFGTIPRPPVGLPGQ